MYAGRLHQACKRRRNVHLKRMVLAFLSAILLAGFVYGFAYAQDPTENEGSISGNEKYYKSIVIEQGDTLWDIARTYVDPHYDSVNDYIEELKRTNQLSSETIHCGQHLLVACYQ